MENHTMKFFVYLLLVIGLLGSGCRSIGPNKVTHDRFAYSQSLAYSWKSQMLLNIVKIRYLDLPVFLDVGQLVTGYSLETSVDVGGNFFSGGGFGSVGGQGRYTDRPTITYKPLTGDRFLEGFLTPIPPVNVFSLLQSGYAADLLLELCLDSFNGLYNRPALLASEREPDPEFFQVLSLMHEVQDAGAFGMKIEEATEEQSALVLFFRDEKATDDILMKLGKIRSLLDVAPDQVQFELVYSPLPGGPGKLGVGTRSLWQILSAMSMGISIPETHRQRQLAPPVKETGEDEPPLLRVHSGPDKPKDSYISISYEDEWFWIANDDWKSKRIFGSILFLFTLTDAGGAENLPTITIPTY